MGLHELPHALTSPVHTRVLLLTCLSDYLPSKFSHLDRGLAYDTRDGITAGAEDADNFKYSYSLDCVWNLPVFKWDLPYIGLYN